MRAYLLLLLVLASGPLHANSPVFSLRGLTVDFSPFSIVADPGEGIDLPLLSGSLERAAFAEATPVEAAISTDELHLSAPEKPGFYPLSLRLADGESVEIQLFVTVPASKVRGKSLNGYRLGTPPPGHPRYPELYRAPNGFIEVSEAMLETRLSPHFTLRQFLCKQESSYPKYVVVTESLLVMLEGLLAAVNERGFSIDTFGVISAYRTPWYNRKIGNVPNSRHVYGDAMDLFVDADKDGRMDDLNSDGVRDFKDVQLLADIADEFMRQPGNSLIFGGVGRYRKTSRHGGFVHVDTRGYAARW